VHRCHAGGGTKNVAPTLQQQSSRISPKTALVAPGQYDKKNLSLYFPPVKIFRDSNENDKHVLARNLFCTAANKNIPAKQNRTKSAWWTDSSQYPHEN